MNFVEIIKVLLPIILQILQKPKTERDTIIAGFREQALESGSAKDAAMLTVLECASEKEGHEREAMLAELRTGSDGLMRMAAADIANQTRKG